MDVACTDVERKTVLIFPVIKRKVKLFHRCWLTGDREAKDHCISRVCTSDQCRNSPQELQSVVVFQGGHEEHRTLVCHMIVTEPGDHRDQVSATLKPNSVT